jgi:hypothetical protein
MGAVIVLWQRAAVPKQLDCLVCWPGTVAVCIQYVGLHGLCVWGGSQLHGCSSRTALRCGLGDLKLLLRDGLQCVVPAAPCLSPLQQRLNAGCGLSRWAASLQLVLVSSPAASKGYKGTGLIPYCLLVIGLVIDGKA